MTQKEKILLATMNGKGKDYLDELIAKEVGKAIRSSEEAAIVRKALFEVICQLAIEVTPAIQEFLDYNYKVEEIKKEVKGTM